MIIFLTAISISLSALIIFLPTSVKRKVSIGGKVIELVEARSIAGKATGLAGRPDKKGENAMLFKFILPSKKIFWTVGMRFPIDIFWIRNKKIISISENISPGTKIIVSPEKADSVIEISSSLRKKEGTPGYGKIIYS